MPEPARAERSVPTWGDDAFALAVGAVDLEERSIAIGGKTAALEKRKGRVPRGLETEYNRLYR